mgnify:CR=1 FL=1
MNTSSYRLDVHMKDYDGQEFITRHKHKRHNKKIEEVKDGLISRLNMDSVDEIQKNLRQQINKLLNKN